MSYIVQTAQSAGTGTQIMPAGAYRSAKAQVTIITVILILILILFVPPLTGYPSLTAADVQLKIGIYENPPKVFTRDEGTPAGIFIDILQEIAKKEGWEIAYVPGTWGEGLERLADGSIDLMPDVAYSSERDDRFDYHSNPVLASWFQVYARKDSDISTILDLDGKTIGVLENSIQHDSFLALSESFGISVALVTAPDYLTLFDMTSSGKADAAISNNFFGLEHAALYNLHDTAIIFSPSNLYFAVREGDPLQLLPSIDKHLDSMKRDHTSVYYESLDQWTEKEVSFKLPVWAVSLITGIGTILLFSLAASMVLRRQVNLRTRELREINEQMEQKIIERTESLNHARERAQESDRLKSIFLATMSHELRTPLNSIIGFTGIMLQGLAGPLNNEQQKQMNMVKTSARHLLALINDVLDISKIEAGQFQLANETFTVMPSIMRVLNLTAPLAGEKQLSLNLENSNLPGGLTITADTRRFEQILLNLLNNAVKFTDSGSVTLSCRLADTESGGKEVIIDVIDTGIGISQQDLGKLFTPFHQVSTGLNRKHEGTGLGLSISRKLAVMMGGSITVSSVPGQGSTFTLTLPQEAPDQPHRSEKVKNP
jgi:signal transduction histidine kinase